ncbi:hypothetical protein R1flu_016695 [Riccia fluitans]|uniref:Uncharacterized protein n=1 Tax=Riccia fluitans TaxID=41844 RepID=A0ABD1YNK9_9MARC
MAPSQPPPCGQSGPATERPRAQSERPGALRPPAAALRMAANLKCPRGRFKSSRKERERERKRTIRGL